MPVTGSSILRRQRPVCDWERRELLAGAGRENSVPNYGCTVDVTGRTAGTYTGTITATVAVL
jgi:hypothetical protein